MADEKDYIELPADQCIAGACDGCRLVHLIVNGPGFEQPQRFSLSIDKAEELFDMLGGALEYLQEMKEKN